MKEAELHHVTLAGDRSGEYLIREEHPDGTLVLEPETAAQSSLRRMGARPATENEAASTFFGASAMGILVALLSPATTALPAPSPHDTSDLTAFGPFVERSPPAGQPWHCSLSAPRLGLLDHEKRDRAPLRTFSPARRAHLALRALK